MGDFGVDGRGVIAALFLLVPLLAGLFLLRGRRGPLLHFSHLSLIQGEKKSLLERLAPLPRYLQLLALLFFLTALLDIHFYRERERKGKGAPERGPYPQEGIAIYLLLDNSRSMEEELDLANPTPGRSVISKMELLKEVTEQFINGDAARGLRGRPSDLIGIVAFARSATVVSPLTLDHGELLKELKALRVNREESELGTALGYAVFKTANLIEATRHYNEEAAREEVKPAYEIKNAVIVLITDGFQETNPGDYDNPLRNMDLSEAVESLKEYGIKLYLVNIDPSINSERYSEHRRYFSLLTEMTGGKFYTVEGGRTLEKIYADIDRLEKGELPQYSRLDKRGMPSLYERVSFAPPLILSGIAALFLSLFLECTLLRRLP